MLALDSEAGALSAKEQKYLQGINDQVAIIVLRGRFSYASARELTHTVGLEESGKRAIIYDFTDTAYVDTSAAIAVEDMVISGIRAAGCLLRLRHLRRYFEYPERAWNAGCNCGR